MLPKLHLVFEYPDHEAFQCTQFPKDSARWGGKTKVAGHQERGRCHGPQLQFLFPLSLLQGPTKISKALTPLLERGLSVLVLYYSPGVHRLLWYRDGSGEVARTWRDYVTHYLWTLTRGFTRLLQLFNLFWKMICHFSGQLDLSVR